MGILSIKYVTGNKLALDTCRNIERPVIFSALRLSQNTGISSTLLRVNKNTRNIYNRQCPLTFHIQYTKA